MKADNKYSNNYNLLRFIFASLVIVSHAIEIKTGNRDHEILTNWFGTLSFGELAVDSFFIISGFLISQSWTDNPKVAPYLRSRILRIYPGFIACSVICTFIIAPLYGGSVSSVKSQGFGYLKSLVFLSGPDLPNVFPGSFYPVLNGSTWSIFIEFLCYLLLMAFGISKLLTKRYPWFLLTICTIGLYALSKLHYIDLSWTYLYVRCIMFFCVGGCFYLYKHNLIWSKKYAALAIFLTLIFLSNPATAEISLALLWGYTIIYYANNGKKLLSFNRLPDISYGIYLYAWPINKIIYQELPNIDQYLCMLMTFILSIAMAIVSWYAIEKPFLKLKKNPYGKFLLPPHDE